MAVDAPPVSYELALKRGIAQLLHDLELGVYKPVGTYLASERGIFTAGDLSTTIPDLIMISAAPFARTQGRASGFTSVQFLIRMTGETTIAENLASEIRDLFEGRVHMTLNGIGISQVTFQSALAVSKDTNGRGACFLNLNFCGRRPIINSPQLG
jgi:hypothetical protein